MDHRGETGPTMRRQGTNAGCSRRDDASCTPTFIVRVNVTYSNRMTQLAAALATALPGPGRLFDGPWLVVSGRPVETFVDLELARRRGISGNVDTMSVSGAFARLCGEAAPDVVLIDRLHVVGELLAFLGTRPATTPGPDDQALAPLDAYLLGAGADGDAVDRRRVAVARAAATLFGTWALTRPERLARWRGERQGRDESATDDRNEDDLRTNDPRLARALRRLWKVLFGPAGRFARRGQEEGRRYLTLDAFLDERLDEAWHPPSAIHVFGLTELPAGMQRPFARLAARTELCIYAINPCREFWEDVQTTRRAPRADRARPARGRARVSDRQLALDIGAPPLATDLVGDDEADAENPFLAAWAMPSRDTVRRLDALCDANAEHRQQVDLEPATLLACVQRDIADRAPARTGPRQLHLPADGSLVVMGAADPRRAWEAVAAEIWELVRGDARPEGPLRFSDIAVLVAGPDEPYLPLAASVFHEANDLPHVLVDAPLPSRVPEAILGLLALPGGELSRREVLDVITHPNVKARFPDANAGAWLVLCEALGIARGADRRAFAGTYVERDLFNWDQGLRRLALGRFATGPRSGDERPLVLAGPRRDRPEPYLPAEVGPDFRDDADALSLLARSLLADVRFAREARLPLGDWLRFVHALLDAYVSPLSSDDEAARLRVFAALDGLGAAHRADTPVRLTVALPLIQEALGGLRGTRGQIFGNGVAIGSLAALQSLPFRVIFVLGLGPERFPASDRPLPFDPGDLPGDLPGELPGESPGASERAGDVTPRQRDRWLFLQALLAARERFYLSYVDRDPLSGDPREPSAVLLELMETLRDGYAEPATWTRAVPAQRDADPRARAAFPIAAAEAAARALGRDLSARVPEAARLREIDVEQGLSPDTRAALAPVLGTVPAAMSPAGEGGRSREARRRVQLDDVRAFLESPLQGGARVALGLRTVDDDTEARATADEPFGVPRLVDRRILSDLFLRVWRDGPAPSMEQLATAYDEALLTQRLAWLLPAGPFASAARARHLDLLDAWREAILGAAAPVRGPAREIVYGRPDPDLTGADGRLDLRPALTLEISVAERQVQLELHGRLRPRLQIGDAEGSLILGASSNGDEDRDGLRPFIEHLVLAAAGSPPATSRYLIVRPRSGGDGASATELVLAPVEAERAHAYLTTLLADLFARPHDYLLPCEAVFRAWQDHEKTRDKDGEARTLRDRIVETRDDPYYRASSNTKFGPVPQPFDYPPPGIDEGERLAEQRFGLFFALRQFVRKPKEKR